VVKGTTVRLSQFIRANLELILEDFEEFARTRTEVGGSVDATVLRDHASEVLEAIARDMEEPRSPRARERRSKGDRPRATGEGTTPAEKHGADRAVTGFSLNEATAEYRALRASVLRRWKEGGFSFHEDTFYDMLRFNEAIDEALAESIDRFSAEMEDSRETFLAILGHDLRTPIGVIVMAATFLRDEGRLSGRNLSMATRIHDTGVRMGRLVDDLLDFTSTRLGSGIPITPARTNVEEIAHQVLEEMRVLSPDREFIFESEGELGGRWDSKRLGQALSNLVGNAVAHGAQDTPVTVRAHGDTAEVIVSVHNFGPAIPEEERETIFEPFRRATAGNPPAYEGKGLGLHIAREIALAHGGTLDVESSGGETTFALRLPRES